MGINTATLWRKFKRETLETVSLLVVAMVGAVFLFGMEPSRAFFFLVYFGLPFSVVWSGVTSYFRVRRGDA